MNQSYAVAEFQPPGRQVARAKLPQCGTGLFDRGFFSMSETHIEDGGTHVRARIREKIDLLLRAFYQSLLEQARNDQTFIERMNALMPQQH